MIPQLAARVRALIVQYPGSTFLLSIGLSLAMLGLGVVLGSISSTQPAELLEMRSNPDSSFQYISPLLQCESSWSDQDQSMPLLRRRLSAVHRELESLDQIDSISLRYVNVHTGDWFEIDGEINYAPASLIKLPVLMAYLKKAESDPSLLDKKVMVPEHLDETFEQNVLPEQQIQPGGEYSIRELLKYMVVYSDNAADSILREGLADQEFFEVLELVGIDPDDIHPVFSVENFMSVREFTGLLRILYNATFLSEEYSEYALSILTQSTFADGLRADIPRSIPIAHKFAERRYLDSGEVQLHDCGIIYTPKMPYALCVMSSGSDMDSLAEAIQSISSTVYELHTAGSL